MDTSSENESSGSNVEKEKKKGRKKKSPQKGAKGKSSKRKASFSNEDVPRIVLLGSTGAGKSHLGNTLLGEPRRFTVSNDPESCTSEASEVVRGYWLGDQDEFEIVDTPGLNDSKGRDTEHIQNIVDNLRDYKFVNTFLIVRNGHEIRMTNTYSDMLRTFEMIFGDIFWEHAVFDVSGSLKKKDVKAAKNWVREIRTKFPNARRVKTVYLDVEDEEDTFDTNVETLWNCLSKMPKFECKDIKMVKADKDRLVEQMEALKEAKLQDVAEYEERLREAKGQAEKAIEEERKMAEAEKREEINKLLEAKVQAEKAIEEERKIAETEKREEINKLLEQVKEKETELHRIGADKTTAVMEINYQLQLMEKERSAKEVWENEKVELLSRHDEMLKNKEKEHREEIEAKVKVESEKTLEKSQTEKYLLAQIQELTRKNELGEVSAVERKKFDAEKDGLIEKHKTDIETWEAKIKEKDACIEKLQDKLAAEGAMKIQQELERVKKIEEDEKANMVQKIKKNEEENNLSNQEFQSAYPSLLSQKDMSNPTPFSTLLSEAKRRGAFERFQTEIEIPLKKDDEIKNRINGIAARIFNTNYPNNSEDGFFSKMFSTKQTRIKKKTLMILGLTGSGKSTFIDSLMNYIFDVRYEDACRLKLVQMTKDEEAKNTHQAVSQTDHIVVYNIRCLPGMKINYDLTLIDTPGFGDTRGVQFDKKLMQNIEDLFKSNKIDTLDAIGFVAKAGDARLTAQQNYIFESILHIFGKDVQDNLISILTNYDGQSVNILDSFKKANMNFVGNFPVNSAAIFQPPPHSGQTIDSKILTSQPKIAQYQQFFDEAQKLTETVLDMVPTSLKQTIAVLNDREKIQVEMQGVQETIQKLLLKKDQVQKETDICNQHSANADANKDSKYEVEELRMNKVELKPGTYVTNCLKCNRTCHYPCAIPNDDGKRGCAAMRGDYCTVCPDKCHWNQHVNNPHRIEFETVKVKKTYEDLVKRHDEFLKKHNGQKTVVDALQEEADAASKKIQDCVPRITRCLENLQENALRPNMSSSADYLEQMISAEEHEQKPGYTERIIQLRIEKDKAKMLGLVQDGKDLMEAKK